MDRESGEEEEGNVAFEEQIQPGCDYEQVHCTLLSPSSSNAHYASCNELPLAIV